MIDAQWIFEHHRLILAQEKFLQVQIIHLTYPNSQHDAEEILSRVLTRPALGTPHQTLFQESSTERVALQMQGKENDQSNITMNECLEKLSCCQQLLEIYDTIISTITPNEASLQMPSVYASTELVITERIPYRLPIVISTSGYYCVVWARIDQWVGSLSSVFLSSCSANPAAELCNNQ